MRRAAILVACLIWSGTAGAEPRSGLEFQSAETRALQADDFANPGMLWVERGQVLWQTPEGRAGKACASCHGDASATMKGVSARYPAFDKRSARVVDVEERINICRIEQLDAAPLPRESDPLLALAALVGHQSRGTATRAVTDGPSAASFAKGKVLFEQRMGQMNLSCKNCHEDNWGKSLRGDTISQGHPTGYPLYRLEWQKLGSLQRRLRFCMTGVRAEPFAYGAQELIDLALYLASRAEGLAVETPAVRR